MNIEMYRWCKSCGAMFGTLGVDRWLCANCRLGNPMMHDPEHGRHERADREEYERQIELDREYFRGA